MTKSTCFPDFAKYASLNVLGMLGLSCYILADTFFISRGLGTNGLAALNLAIPIYSFIHGGGLMIGMGGGTRYAIQKSRKEHASANRTFTQAVWLAAFLAAFFVLLGLFFPGALLSLFGADGRVFDLSRTYLQVILLFAPAFLLNNVLLCFVRNDGAPQLSMAAMIGGSLSNVILDWLFIFPCNLGIFGAAFATGLAPIISMLILSSHFIRKKNGFRPAACGPEAGESAAILSSGVPAFITEASSGIVMIVFNALLMRLQGHVGVAAYGVIANLSLVVLSMYTGIAQGIQPLVSRSYGAGRIADMRAVLRYALAAMLILSGVVYSVIAAGAPHITGLFNSGQDARLQSLATQGLRLYFTACPFAGFNILLSVYFTSSGHPRPAHILSILRGFALLIPLAFLLSALAGVVGVWCSFPATELATAAAGWLFYRSYKKASAL